eukprot:scpid91417/ scgid31177/ 
MYASIRSYQTPGQLLNHGETLCFSSANGFTLPLFTVGTVQCHMLLPKEGIAIVVMQKNSMESLVICSKERTVDSLHDPPLFCFQFIIFTDLFNSTFVSRPGLTPAFQINTD